MKSPEALLLYVQSWSPGVIMKRTVAVLFPALRLTCSHYTPTAIGPTSKLLCESFWVCFSLFWDKLVPDYAV